ncbi:MULTISPECIES: hypothetical protein [Streptomyces]
MKKRTQRKELQTNAALSGWRQVLTTTAIRVITAVLVILMHHEQ